MWRQVFVPWLPDEFRAGVAAVQNQTAVGIDCVHVVNATQVGGDLVGGQSDIRNRHGPVSADQRPIRGQAIVDARLHLTQKGDVAAFGGDVEGPAREGTVVDGGVAGGAADARVVLHVVAEEDRTSFRVRIPGGA